MAIHTTTITCPRCQESISASTDYNEVPSNPKQTQQNKDAAQNKNDEKINATVKSSHRNCPIVRK